MLIPKLLARGLSRVLNATRAEGATVLGGTHRYVIFSDHHKGGGTGADDFTLSKGTYLRALDHYYGQDFQLIILGDGEELWEEPIERVVQTHGDVLRSEARFHEQGRYLRIFGNHDSNWASAGQVKKHLHPFFPGLEVKEGILFQYNDPDAESSGQLFLVHGHQGTLDSEFFAPISRVIVRAVWRTFQILIRYAGTTPAKDAGLRGKHDTLMYQWASKQGKLLLIAGHTHRSIWSSRTLLETKLAELDALQMANEITPIPDYRARRAALREEIRRLIAEDPLRDDSIKTRGCYFNDGCCSYNSGEVTAYELVDGQLRLVRWARDGSAAELLGGDRLANIFFSL
jgi:UDP-2,3-diacylglucosamine pyrophosphatase LpxH